MQDLAFLNRGVTIEISDERSDQKESYCYENGIIDYVNDFMGANNEALSEVSRFIDYKDQRFTKIFNCIFNRFQQDLEPALEKSWDLHCSLFLDTDQEQEDILENEYLVVHLPPTYPVSNHNEYDITHFSEELGYDKDEIEQVANMCKGDRIDLEDIVIIRTN